MERRRKPVRILLLGLILILCLLAALPQAGFAETKKQDGNQKEEQTIAAENEDQDGPEAEDGPDQQAEDGEQEEFPTFTGELGGLSLPEEAEEKEDQPAEEQPEQEKQVEAETPAKDSASETIVLTAFL